MIGVGIYAIIWSILFIARKDLRKKILITSLFAAPLGISELLFIPEYWIPQFQTIPIFEELFLESILFCFFLGGVVSVIYQGITNNKMFEFGKINPYLTLIAPAIFLTYFLKIFYINPIYYVFISMLVGSFILLIYLKKNAIKIVYSALINTILYFAFYYIISQIFPELSASYQINNFYGILVNGIPIEEFIWIFSFSLYWTPLYEIWRNYLNSALKRSRTMQHKYNHSKNKDN